MRPPRLALALLVPLAPVAFGDGRAPVESESPRFSFSLVLSDLEPTRERDLRKPELYWAGVAASWRKGGWGAEAEVRGRDGLFRPYYGGNIWLQKGAAVFGTGAGDLRIGKVDSVTGVVDETLGGDLFSLNGAGRNPQWGASLTGSKGFGYDTLAWALRYSGRNDHVGWEEAGRDVEGDSGARLTCGVEGRVSYVVNKGLVTFRPGLSASAARIESPAAGGSFGRTDLSVDARVTGGPLAVEMLAMNRTGSTAAALAASGADGRPRFGYDRGRSWLFAFSAEFPTVTYRYSYSEWTYLGVDANERIHRPSVVWTPRSGISATVEFASRRLRSVAGAGIFNAFQFGLALIF